MQNKIEKITLESLLKPNLIRAFGDKYKDSIEFLYDEEPANDAYSDDIEVIDRRLSDGKIFHFIWNREKSNSNIKDMRDGKQGFSFYYARYLYRDPYIMECPELASDKRNTVFVGQILDSNTMYDKQKYPVMLVIQAKKEQSDRIRIISAYLSGDIKLRLQYLQRSRIIKIDEKYVELMEFEGSDINHISDATREYERRRAERGYFEYPDKLDLDALNS